MTSRHHGHAACERCPAKPGTSWPTRSRATGLPGPRLTRRPSRPSSWRSRRRFRSRTGPRTC
eukprot:9631609-Alexandrium_andersonii.AAC.1